MIEARYVRAAGVSGFRKMRDGRLSPYMPPRQDRRDGPGLANDAIGRSEERPLHSPSLGTGVFQTPYATGYGTGLAGASLKLA